MQFTTAILSALSLGGALAATTTVTVHVVQVGNSNGSLAYYPNRVTAAVGDMVQFQFAPKNHTVTQSAFDTPCSPLSDTSNTTGIFSGFMPVSSTDTDTATYTVQINDTKPIWVYCSQGKHCQSGMVMVINENTTANASRSLENFATLAASATANLYPGESTNTTTDGTSSSTSSSSSSSSSAATTNDGMHLAPSLSLGGLVALAMVMFV